MGELTLILGGARSGKSTYAERLANRSPGPVLYIATAQALDDEMASRITAHRSQRPEGWRTLEIPFGVGAALVHDQPQEGVVLLDCLTLLVANLILRACPDIDNPDERQAQSAVEKELEQLEQAIQRSAADWIVVSNEVGLGLVPPYPVGRIYRDLLGWANQRLARRAARTVFMIAGLPMRLVREEDD